MQAILKEKNKASSTQRKKQQYISHYFWGRRYRFITHLVVRYNLRSTTCS